MRSVLVGQIGLCVYGTNGLPMVIGQWVVYQAYLDIERAYAARLIQITYRGKGLIDLVLKTPSGGIINAFPDECYPLCRLWLVKDDN